MKSKMMLRKTAAIISAAAIMTSCAKDNPAAISVGDPMPNFTVTLNDGTIVSTPSLCEGKTLVAFFNTGCGDCREELPVLQQFYDYHRDEVKFVLISREESEDSIFGYWKINDMVMPYSAQKSRAIFNLFASDTIPRCYCFIEGRVTAIFTDSPIATLGDLERNFGLELSEQQ